jgi:hypothetical protein
MAKPVLPSLSLLTMFALTGCSTAVDHPSLAPRAIEHFTVAEPTPPQLPPAALPEDASRQERVAALAAQAKAGDERFRAALAQAETTVATASGAAPASENWVQAQQAVSRVEVLQDPVARSLVELDAIQITAAEAGIGSETGATLAATLQEVVTIDTREREAIAALRDRLPTP